MIKAIDIQSFGIYNDFSWNREISEVNGDKDLKQVNIIYGRNYSGKTTLSRIVRCLEKNSLHSDYDNCNFTIACTDSLQINQDNLDSHPLNVYVYNTDFVKENLQWLYNTNGTIEPFTVLGAENVEIEQQINELIRQIGQNSEEERTGLSNELHNVLVAYQDVNGRYTSRKRELEDSLRNKANQDIKTNPLYGQVNYNISQIKKDIQSIIENPRERLVENQIEALKSLINEIRKEPISLLPERKLHFKEHAEETKKLVERQIALSQPIAELIHDSVLQEWVRKGRELHNEAKEKCAFCGSIIDESLWKKLDEHFNKESEQLRSDITELINRLDSTKGMLDSYIVYDKEDFYSMYKEPYSDLRAGWTGLKQQYENEINKLIIILKKRHDDIFNQLEMTEVTDVSEEIYLLIQELNNLIVENNEKTNTLTTEQIEGKRLVRLDEILKYMHTIDYTSKTVEITTLEEQNTILEEQVKQIRRQIDQFNDQIRILQTQLQDESRGAELVNEYLGNFFGNSSFKLVSVEDGDGVRYKVMRGDNEANNLSEGECSLISFCYFIAKIKDMMNDEQEGNRPIIYIDDPISSLDSNHIFFMFSLIEQEIAKPKKYKQLFISTHNLDFLKYIKRLTVQEKENNLRHFFIERVQRQNEKKSLIKVMPNYLKKYTTEFNYLFNEIYQFSQEVRGDRSQMINNTCNTFYNIPNNIRKFLEYYLFYKYPNTENPLNNIDKLFDENVPPLLQRVINEYSHLTFIDRGWSPMDVAEVEDCARIIIEKIKDKDREQFDALVQSIQ